MENLCEYSARLRSGPDKCSGTRNFLPEKKAILCGYYRPVWLCRNHERTAETENQTTCCFPSQNKCTKRSGLVPCPQRVLGTLTSLEMYKGGTFLCINHLSLLDEDPLITSHKLYKPPASRKVGYLCLKYYFNNIMTHQ